MGIRGRGWHRCLDWGFVAVQVCMYVLCNAGFAVLELVYRFCDVHANAIGCGE